MRALQDEGVKIKTKDLRTYTIIRGNLTSVGSARVTAEKEKEMAGVQEHEVKCPKCTFVRSSFQSEGEEK
jgi:hypothetical protein